MHVIQTVTIGLCVTGHHSQAPTFALPETEDGSTGRSVYEERASRESNTRLNCNMVVSYQ